MLVKLKSENVWRLMKLLIDKLTLPYPPSINAYYGVVGMGKGTRKYITAQGKKFRQEVVDIVRKAEYDNNIDADLHVDIKWYVPDRRPRDVDNPVKPLFDAMEHANVYTNDKIIISFYCKKCPFEGKKNARAEITIYELDEDE